MRKVSREGDRAGGQGGSERSIEVIVKMRKVSREGDRAGGQGGSEEVLKLLWK